MTDPISLRRALEDITEIGSFFVASANPAEAVDPSWRPVRELYTDPAPLATRFAQVSAVLRTEDARLAASIAHQGLAARLVSPVIALASVHGLVPSWSPDTLHWRHAVIGAWPLWESARECARPTPQRLPAAVTEALVEPHLTRLAAVVRAGASVSAHTLRGNAASSVVAAGRVVASARPASAGMAARVVAGLLASAPLAGAGTLVGEWDFRRRSCCLYYRLPGGGTCGDCVLASRGDRSARG